MILQLFHNELLKVITASEIILKSGDDDVFDLFLLQTLTQRWILDFIIVIEMCPTLGVLPLGKKEGMG